MSLVVVFVGILLIVGVGCSVKVRLIVVVEMLCSWLVIVVYRC